jgi:hypothetical protein
VTLLVSVAVNTLSPPLALARGPGLRGTARRLLRKARRRADRCGLTLRYALRERCSRLRRSAALHVRCVAYAVCHAACGAMRRARHSGSRSVPRIEGRCINYFFHPVVRPLPCKPENAWPVSYSSPAIYPCFYAVSATLDGTLREPRANPFPAQPRTAHTLAPQNREGGTGDWRATTTHTHRSP